MPPSDERVVTALGAVEDSRQSLRSQVARIKHLIWFELHREPGNTIERGAGVRRSARRWLQRKQERHADVAAHAGTGVPSVERAAASATLAGSTSVARGDFEPGQDDSPGR